MLVPHRGVHVLKQEQASSLLPVFREYQILHIVVVLLLTRPQCNLPDRTPWTWCESQGRYWEVDNFHGMQQLEPDTLQLAESYAFRLHAPSLAFSLLSRE